MAETARLLEIEDCLNKYPYQMSGGQCQRTAAARAIITNPALILADEPTGALDSKSARLLLDRFEALNREREATILMVTHDAFTASYCHRILFIKDGRPFTELVRGNKSRKDFFGEIIEVVTLLGGDSGDVLLSWPEKMLPRACGIIPSISLRCSLVCASFTSLTPWKISGSWSFWPSRTATMSGPSSS